MLSGIVTLLTDFGVKDPFVGVMKGVILGRCRSASIVDLAHGVGAQDVAEGAFWLERCYRWFPEGSVHLAVVDPGVGSERAAVAMAARGHFFVGPDNGLLAGVADGGAVHGIDPAALGVRQPSRTFHGRDLFAPAAAELLRGRSLQELGPSTTLLVPSPLAAARREAGEVHGVVVSVDHFGNAITNIGRELLDGIEEPRVHAGARVLELIGTYSELEPGAAGALVSSFETVEIACRDGNAALALGLGRGAAVRVADWRPAAASTKLRP
jgi:S-adenosyl-L-methionine hydrolase (adenosine-forming)